MMAMTPLMKILGIKIIGLLKVVEGIGRLDKFVYLALIDFINLR
jgi:hypothetical protein